MDDQVRDKIVKHIKSRVSGECSFCKSKNFSYEGIYESKEYHWGNFVPGASMIPIVVLVCVNCSHLELFSAVKLGIIDLETGRLKL